MKRRDFLKLTLTSALVASAPLSINADNKKRLSAPEEIDRKNGSASIHFEQQPDVQSIYLSVVNSTDQSIFIRVDAQTDTPGTRHLMEIYHDKELQEHIPHGWKVEFYTIGGNKNEQKRWHEFIAGQDNEAARVIEIYVDENDTGTLFIAEQIGMPD